MRAMFAAGLMALAAACGPTEPAKVAPTADEIAAESKKLTEFLDKEFEEEAQLSPITLTQMSRKEQYDKLDDFTAAGELKLLDWRRESVKQMKEAVDPAKLNDDAQISWNIWENELARAESRYKWLDHSYVFGFGGPHTDLPNFLVEYHKVDTAADMDALIARYGELGRVIDEATARAKAAAEKGIRTPAFAYEMTSQQAKSVISGAPFGPGPDSALLEDAKKKIAALVAAKTVEPKHAAELEAAARSALQMQVKPAYERLIAWLAEDAKNAKSGKVGAATLPDGAAWYDASLEYQTTTDMTADQIHELGLAEVKRIQGEMDKIRVSTGFKGDGKAFFEFMRTDKQFYLPNTDAGRQQYIDKANAYMKGMEAKLPEYFGLLPKAKLEVRREPRISERKGGAAHYNRPTPDGSQPGIFYAHLVDMSAVSMWALESLAYHEGIPGHHLQIAIQGELENIPVFRTQYGYSAFAEGWGLYAEDLGKEMGFFTDPYNDFGRLSSELWRAVRLVLDTGLHAKGWSEEEAVKWAMDNSPRPESSIRSEVQRFLLWPGQATTYKIGMIRIQQLRGEAKAALGDKFSYKAFHDTVIGGGSMPLPILEKRVRAWIERAKAG